MPNERLYYLDNLRSFAMLYGVFVHTLTLEDFGALEWVSGISAFFRMAAFFLVSGFFAGLVFDRRGLRQFWTQRLTALLVPFATTVILINPVTWLLIYSWHNNPPISPADYAPTLWLLLTKPGYYSGPIIWYLHLWFLLSLTGFVLLTPVLAGLFRHAWATRLADKISRLPRFVTPLCLALMVCAMGIGSRSLYALAIEPYFGDRWLMRAGFNYFPYFALGLLLYFQRALWQAAHRIDPLLIGIGVILWITLTPGVPRSNSPLDILLSISATYLITTAAVFFLLWGFRRFLSGSSRLGSLLSRSIYSVYLLHFIGIYSLCWLIAPLGLSLPGFYFAVALTTIGVTLALHNGGIAKQPILLFLLNGKRAPTPAPRPRPASQPRP